MGHLGVNSCVNCIICLTENTEWFYVLLKKLKVEVLYFQKEEKLCVEQDSKPPYVYLLYTN